MANITLGNVQESVADAQGHRRCWGAGALRKVQLLRRTASELRIAKKTERTPSLS